jgi:hypothetical protein
MKTKNGTATMRMGNDCDGDSRRRIEKATQTATTTDGDDRLSVDEGTKFFVEVQYVVTSVQVLRSSC